MHRRDGLSGFGARLTHPYPRRQGEGWSVLDSVAGCAENVPTVANSVVIVGQSQGSAPAALLGSTVAKDYAPGVKLLARSRPESYTRPLRLQRKPRRWTCRTAQGVDSTRLFTASNLHTFMILDPGFDPSQYLSDAAKPAF